MRLSLILRLVSLLIFVTAPNVLNCLAGPVTTPSAAQASVMPAPEHLVSDSTRTTPAGATFTAPGGWLISVTEKEIVLDAPEGDSHVAIVDIHAPDAYTAAAAAWATYQPNSRRPLKMSTLGQARNGWDERRIFDYETSPNERAFVRAFALRVGKTWTVVIFESTEPTFEKRFAQFRLIIQSLRPHGYHPESFAGRKALPLNPQRIEQIKAFVETSMKELGIPGAGLALVDRGEVVYEGGIGLRELGRPAQVDANTLFMAASNTKAMTTLLLAMLADDKKLEWEQPVTQVYPAFKLGDAEVTRKVLIKHLVCACTGLPRQDYERIFEFGNATPATTIRLLAQVKPTSRFGEVFQYSNLMAAAAGYIGAHLNEPSRELGAAYRDSVQKRIFTPLGMNSTTFDMERARAANHASPHGDDVDGKPAVADMAYNYYVVPSQPSGGMWTSAHDLIRYVQLELARGKLRNGKQLVSEANLLIRRKPQIAIGENQYYGMGLMVDSTWGVPVIHHGGSVAGFKSDMMFLPDQGIGAVLLTNADNGEMLLRPFMRRLLEIVFDGKPEAVGDVDEQAARHKASMAKERERLVVPAAKADVAKLAARYKSSELGELKVRRQGTNTLFDFGEWKSTVASRENDDGTTSFVTIDPAVDGFEFVVGQRNGKRVLILRDSQHEYVFEEV